LLLPVRFSINMLCGNPESFQNYRVLMQNPWLEGNLEKRHKMGEIDRVLFLGIDIKKT
jgi:hypothetical protein